MEQEFADSLLIDNQSDTVVFTTPIWQLTKNTPEDFKAGFNAQHQFGEMYIEKQLPPRPFEPKSQELGSPLFWVYLVMVIVWGFYYRDNFKTLQNVIVSFRSNTAFYQMIDERRTHNSIVSIGMFLMGLVVLAIFIYHFIKALPFSEFQNFSTGTMRTVGILIGGVLALQFVRFIIFKLSGLIFQESRLMNAYRMLNIISIQVLGMVLFPFILFLTYAYQINSLVIATAGMTLIGVFFLYRIMRTFILGAKETNGHALHIILYICALEILPLFVLGRLLVLK